MSIITLSSLNLWCLQHNNISPQQVFTEDTLRNESHWLRSVHVGSAIEVMKGPEAIFQRVTSSPRSNDVQYVVGKVLQIVYESTFPGQLFLVIQFDFNSEPPIETSIKLNINYSLHRLKALTKENGRVIYGLGSIHLSSNKIGKWDRCFANRIIGYGSAQCTHCKRIYCIKCFPEKVVSSNESFFKCRYCLISDRYHHLFITARGLFYSLFDRKQQIETNIIDVIRNYSIFEVEKDIKCCNEIRTCTNIKNIYFDERMIIQSHDDFRISTATENTRVLCSRCVDDKNDQYDDSQCVVYHERDGKESMKCIQCGTLSCNRCLNVEYIQCTLCKGFICAECEFGTWVNCIHTDGRYCDSCIRSECSKNVGFCVTMYCHHIVCVLCGDRCESCKYKTCTVDEYNDGTKCDICVICGGSGLQYWTDGMKIPCDECDAGDQYDSDYVESD